MFLAVYSDHMFSIHESQATIIMRRQLERNSYFFLPPVQEACQTKGNNANSEKHTGYQQIVTCW